VEGERKIMNKLKKETAIEIIQGIMMAYNISIKEIQKDNEKGEWVFIPKQK
jgi:hypothetical protein